MFIVGLTGGIGSGKSEVAGMFAALGVPVIDTDLISHRLTAAGSPLLPRIATALGSDSLNPDGSLNRARVREKVFSDPAARRQLEAILHPAIRREAETESALHAGAPYQIIVVPLLFETEGYTDGVNRTLLVDCPEPVQIARTMQRSRLDEPAVRAIMAAQMPRAQKLALADDVIENDGSIAQLAEKVREKHEKYIEACRVR